jgi:MFS family permease
VVFTDPILRAFGAHGATMSLFQAANTAISVVFLVRVVGLSAGVIGVLSSAALVGAVASAAVTGALTRALGSARLLLLAGLVGGAGFLLQPLTAPGWRLVWTVACGFLSGAAIIVLNIVEVSYQQAACPPASQGRVNATMRFLVWGAIPVGSVLGGALGTALGLRPTLWLAGAGTLLAAAWLVCSPLRTMRDLLVPRTAH